jgi:hypothetical protein
VYSVELDPAQRLLVISAARHVTAGEARKTVEELRTLLKDIAPGFRVLADFRWLESMDPAAAHSIAEIMDLLAAKKGRVGRARDRRSTQGHRLQYSFAVSLWP